MLPESPVEGEQTPDLLLEPSTIHETVAEAKFIHASAGDAAVRRRIGKANRQMREWLANERSREGSGVLFLWLDRVPTQGHIPLDSPPPSPLGEDPPPDDLADRVAAIQACLASGRHRSVAVVVAVWDDYSLAGTWPGPTTHFFRRRAQVFTHPKPREEVAIPLDKLVLGGWAAFGVGPMEAASGHPTARAEASRARPARRSGATPPCTTGSGQT
jgi:hypothetical protein